jgi:hypothetical protein
MVGSKASDAKRAARYLSLRSSCSSGSLQKHTLEQFFGGGSSSVAGLEEPIVAGLVARNEPRADVVGRKHIHVGDSLDLPWRDRTFVDVERDMPESARDKDSPSSADDDARRSSHQPKRATDSRAHSASAALDQLPCGLATIVSAVDHPVQRKRSPDRVSRIARVAIGCDPTRPAAASGEVFSGMADVTRGRS